MLEALFANRLVDENKNGRMIKDSGARCQNGASSRKVLAIYNLFQHLNPHASIWRVICQYGAVVSVNGQLHFWGLQENNATA
jgi:hypothetical protein